MSPERPSSQPHERRGQQAGENEGPRDEHAPGSLRILLLEPGEGRQVLAGALAAGLVLLAYGLLKPARDAVFAAEGTGR